jgi:hypothetical protein
MLMMVKAEETLAMVQNVVVPYIEVEWSKDENLHPFEIVNTDTMLRKPVISKAIRMAAKYFLKHRLSF